MPVMFEFPMQICKIFAPRMPKKHILMHPVETMTSMHVSTCLSMLYRLYQPMIHPDGSVYPLCIADIHPCWQGIHPCMGPAKGMLYHAKRPHHMYTGATGTYSPQNVITKGTNPACFTRNTHYYCMQNCLNTSYHTLHWSSCQQYPPPCCTTGSLPHLICAMVISIHYQATRVVDQKGMMTLTAT